MSKRNARQEAKPETIEANSPIFIDSTALGKKGSLHILHVDDDLCVLEVSKQLLLIENNFEIESVTSVDEAFKKWRGKLLMRLFLTMRYSKEWIGLFERTKTTAKR
jgi:hypothetical protein